MKRFLSVVLLFSIHLDTFSQVNLTQGLVAYYPFSGNSLDASGNNNNATNFGATLTSDQWGNPNSAYLFNGTSNYMSVATSPTLQMQSITLCARVKPNAFYPGLCFNNSIIDRGNGGFNYGSFSLVYTPTLNQNPGTYCITPDTTFENYRINVNISANASLWCITPINAVPYVSTNQWDCVIGVYDSATHVGAMYVNGIFRYSYTYPNGMGAVNNNSLFIGGTTNPTYPYYVNGVLDELRIYNRPLNTQEIDSICNLAPLDTVTADFSFLYPTTCDSTVIQFTDLSTAVNSTIVAWDWNFGDGNTSNSQNPLHNYLNSGTYNATLIVTNNFSQNDTFSLNVFVSANAPTIIANTNIPLICYGNTVVLTGSGGVSYIWSGGVIDGVAFAPLATGIYTVVGTDANGCTNSSSIIVTVNPLPNIMTNASPPAVCPGAQTTLTGSGGISYIWSGGVTDGVPFNPLVTATYTVTGTDANGCSNSSTAIVSVVPLPNITGNASPASVCLGSQTTLTGSGGVSYNWSGGITNALAFVPLATTIYTVTGTDTNGCSNTSTLLVTVNPLPNISATASPPAVCSGSQTTLTGSGGVTYLWSGGVINGTPFSPPATTVYTVTGSGANGCTNAASLILTVNPLPNITANANPPAVCPGNTTTLTGSGGISYGWTGGITNGIPFIPLANATYTVTGTDANGCTNTSSVTVTLNPDLLITILPDLPVICIGDSIQLTASGALNYTWASTPGLSTYTGSTVWAFPVVSTMYTVTGADANGCSGTSTVLVSISNGIDVQVAKNHDAECEMNIVEIQASGAQNYTWTPSALVSNPNAPVTNATVVKTTIFYATGYSGACTDVDSITVYYFNNDETGIIIPSAFSPNQDGLNDCFRIIHNANFKSYYLSIFNRWGQLMFETKDPSICWNGEFNNEPLKMDSYYYYLKAETICGKIFKKGDVTLVR